MQGLASKDDAFLTKESGVHLRGANDIGLSHNVLTTEDHLAQLASVVAETFDIIKYPIISSS